ncbi:hypothetical protein FBU30_002918 [Linnemannia zychae]|nr:hypothetical protein FBU30_002918 [Linnemannia zychae]
MTTSKSQSNTGPSAPIPEEERATFGQQSPYAPPSSSSSFSPATSPLLPNNQPSNTFSPQHQPFVAPTAPIHDDSYDDQPPAYEETVGARALPQNNHPGYGGSNNNPDSSTSRTPLLPPNQPNSYSAIPPATPYTPGSPTSSDDDDSRTFNKFWLIFLAVVAFLSVTADDDKEPDTGVCNVGFTRPIFSHNVPISINNIEITAEGMPAMVFFEQMESEGDDPEKALLTVLATGRDRDEIRRISRGANVDPTKGKLRINIAKTGDVVPSECMATTIKLSIPPSMKLIERLKVIVDEGNITLALLDPRFPLQIKDLNTRVVTGYTQVNAMATALQLGGSVGVIEGNVFVGSSMSVLLVDGYVSLNVTQSAKTMNGKVNVTNGNIDVGLMAPYEGLFQLEANTGLVQIHHVDLSTTKLEYESNNLASGWRSSTGKKPYGKSSLVLGTHAGMVDLDIER